MAVSARGCPSRPVWWGPVAPSVPPGHDRWLPGLDRTRRPEADRDDPPGPRGGTAGLDARTRRAVSADDAGTAGDVPADAGGDVAAGGARELRDGHALSRAGPWGGKD